MKSDLKQDNVAPLTPHNFTLFELDFNVKFPLLRNLNFLSDIKGTIYDILIKSNKGIFLPMIIFESRSPVRCSKEGLLPPTPTQHYLACVKFPFLCLLQFLSDLKSTNFLPMIIFESRSPVRCSKEGLKRTGQVHKSVAHQEKHTEIEKIILHIEYYLRFTSLITA